MHLEFTRIIIVLHEYMVYSDDAIGIGLGDPLLFSFRLILFKYIESPLDI